MRPYYPSSVKADLREEPTGFVASIDGVDVVKANVVKVSEYESRVERQILESKYSNCDPYPQFLSADVPRRDPPPVEQLLSTQADFRLALDKGEGVKVALMHRSLCPKIKNDEVQSWWCHDCGLQVEAPDG